MDQFVNWCVTNIPCEGVTIFHILGIAGAILITYGVFLEVERRQDIVKFLGALCLFLYGMFAQDIIIMIAMAGLGLASLIELIEIMMGLHKHAPDNLKKQVRDLRRNK